MRPRMRIVLTGIVVFLAAEVSTDAQSITSFDPPGSILTWPLGINDRGTITGYYLDGVAYQYHGFIRDARGTITSFDPLGSINTYTSGINNAGMVTGYYFDGSNNF